MRNYAIARSILTSRSHPQANLLRHYYRDQGDHTSPTPLAGIENRRSGYLAYLRLRRVPLPHSPRSRITAMIMMITDGVDHIPV